MKKMVDREFYEKKWSIEGFMKKNWSNEDFFQRRWSVTTTSEKIKKKTGQT